MKKSITQTIIYLFEVLLFCLLIISIFSKIEHGSFFFWWHKEIFTLEFLADFGVVFVFYQVLVFAISSLYDSSRIDALLEISSIIKLTIHFSNYGFTFEGIKDKLNLFLREERGKYMFSKKDYTILELVDDLINKYSNGEITIEELHFNLETRLILIEHDSAYHGLLWRNSLLLKFGK